MRTTLTVVALGAVLAGCVCSPGVGRAAPTPAPVVTTSPPDLLADEEALRNQITPAPWHLTATLDVAQARPGGTYVVRGTSDCGALTVGIEGAEPPREEPSARRSRCANASPRRSRRTSGRCPSERRAARPRQTRSSCCRCA